MIITFQQNCAVVDPRHLLEQSSIKDKELELIQLVKGGKRMFHLGDIVDPVQHPSGDEPFYRFLEVSGTASFPDSAVHELLIGLASWETILRKTIRIRPLLTLPLCLEKSFS